MPTCADTKSPFLLTTNQNTTSPALHHQNQPPDSGSVHESQRRQLGYCCIAVTATHAVCVFVLECFTISEERRGDVVSTARPPATKSPFLLMINQNTTSPAPHHQNQPHDFGSVHESQQQQLRLSLHRSHRHTCCVRVRSVFYNFPWREAAQLMCLAALRFCEGCHLKILGQDFVKRAHFWPSENLGKIFRQRFYP